MRLLPDASAERVCCGVKLHYLVDSASDGASVKLGVSLAVGALLCATSVLCGQAYPAVQGVGRLGFTRNGSTTSEDITEGRVGFAGITLALRRSC